MFPWRSAVRANGTQAAPKTHVGHQSKSVGQSKDGGESTGHASGRRIVEILQTNKSDLTDDDADHMRKVVSYVHRHQAQEPDGDVTDTKWRYSLMNWGHDPLK